MRQKMWFRGHVLLLVLWFGVEVCNARPQSRAVASSDADSPAPSSGGARLTNEERAFFAPGSWQPIPSQFSGLVIDEAPSRVRVEKYDSSARDARSKQDTISTPAVATPTNNNATGNTTTRGKSPTPLGDAIKMVASQLLQSRGAVAESDVRAPPAKLKESQPSASKVDKQKLQQRTEEEDEISHEGVAIPVMIEEAEHLTATQKTTTKKTHSTASVKKQQAATTKKPTPTTALRHPVTSVPDGLTTWVFLSGSSAAELVATTPTPTLSTRLATRSSATTKKRLTTTTTTATPSEKTAQQNVKKPSPLFTSSGTKPNRATKKPVDESATVKSKNKEALDNKPTASRLEEGVAFRRRPVSSVEATPSSTTTTFKPLPTAYPLSTAAALSSDETSSEVSSSEEDNNSTEILAEDTTTTAKPKTKKKNKNKNKRRRRPVVKPQEEEDEDADYYAELQSKIEGDDEQGLATKTPGKPARPLTTRIYNYLAREIMPSVGVGLIGLVGLAGLAGLIMYPFGGGVLPVRRNYNSAATPRPNYYYYENEEGGQSEEEVLGKVLAGMKDPSYVVGEQASSSYNVQSEPESRTRYDVRVQETQPQPIRNDYDVSGRIPAKNRRRQDEEQPANDYESEVAASRVSAANRQDVRKQETVIQGSVHSEETHYGSGEAARAPVQTRGSEPAPQASALFQPRPVFNNDWSMVKTDAQEAVSSSNNNHNNHHLHGHHELKYGAGEEGGEAVYGQNPGYDSPQYSGVSRVGIGQKRTVEHGPRRLRRDVIKKDAAREDLEENEIIDLEVSDEPVYTVQRVQVEEDGDVKVAEDEEKVTKAPKKDLGMALKKTTPMKLDAIEMDTTTEAKAITESNTDSSEDFTEDSDTSDESTDITNEASDKRNDNVESTTTRIVSVVDDDEDSVKVETTSSPLDVTTSTEENITLETESPEDPSLVGLIRRVAQYKIRLGLSFLRNTSQAFSRYLEGMQKRVEEVVKENARNRNRLLKRKSAHEEYY